MENSVESEVKEVIKKNPSAILESVVDPSPLTISQIAALEKIKSPVLDNDVTNLGENIKAAYVVNIPYSDAAKEIRDGTLEEKSMEWADSLGWEEFQNRLAGLVLGVIGFWKMLPPPESEESQKKKAVEPKESAMDG